ncbi:alpha/beta fold hydrolase [Peribacillus deserti]|uniref:Proline iminopeptidase n=1 Tax=Peribacillus deserti TaxID=673318 RepID=A0A2N5M254_9BACI|nr:alpha/beta fold hydrolase [Peribacillus deserti]PLT28447.1 proline iminopeptidase [Peribacillus deserti]
MVNNWETRMVDTDRGIFEVFFKGEGPPLCVTHTYSEFNATGDLFADTFTKKNQVFLVNLREAGRSAKVIEPYQLSMIETVFDLEAVREALGFTSWHFAGHSTGGMIGLLYGVWSSASLDSLIVVGTAAREYSNSSSKCIYHRNHPKYTKMQELIERLKLTGLSNEERSSITRERNCLSLYQPENYDLYFNTQVRKKMAASRMDYFNRELVIYDITKKLHRITVKTLILCGKHDVQCPLPFSEEIQLLIPGSILKVFEESNHYPFLEEAELFRKEINSFLSTI